MTDFKGRKTITCPECNGRGYDLDALGRGKFVDCNLCGKDKFIYEDELSEAQKKKYGLDK